MKIERSIETIISNYDPVRPLLKEEVDPICKLLVAKSGVPLSESEKADIDYLAEVFPQGLYLVKNDQGMPISLLIFTKLELSSNFKDVPAGTEHFFRRNKFVDDGNTLTLVKAVTDPDYHNQKTKDLLMRTAMALGEGEKVEKIVCPIKPDGFGLEISGIDIDWWEHIFSRNYEHDSVDLNHYQKEGR